MMLILTTLFNIANHSLTGPLLCFMVPSTYHLLNILSFPTSKIFLSLPKSECNSIGVWILTFCSAVYSQHLEHSSCIINILLLIVLLYQWYVVVEQLALTWLLQGRKDSFPDQDFQQGLYLFETQYSSLKSSVEQIVIRVLFSEHGIGSSGVMYSC